jgi:adenosine deaminase
MQPRTPLPAGALRRLFTGALLLAAGLLPDAAAGQTARAGLSAEERTARYLESVRDRPPLLVAFLRRMPKGGDLHNHLSGAVYAESYVQWAAEGGLCVNTRTLALSAAPCDSAAGRIPVRGAARDPVLYGQMIDAWSMRNWDPARVNGHDQFFSTFGKFGAATEGRTGDMLAEAASRAAAGGVGYLELIFTPDGRRVSRLGAGVGWHADLDTLRGRLLAGGIRDSLEVARRMLDSAEVRQRALLRCGTAQADAGCAVVTRYLYQVARAQAPEQVFAQILAGFEMASRDRRVVGLNLVQPEDHPVAMRDYSLHMRMIGHLRRLYPGVSVTLHAGELAPGLVPPEGLRSHIREAVEVAGAERIGHGVDVMFEDRPFELLREMAGRGVLVEIALTSNDVILGVKGTEHPLSVYLQHGVPVALVTDDEGVARSEMTTEYRKAVEEQGLGYVALKAMARNSLQHAFVEGKSLWRNPRELTPVTDCAPAAGGMEGKRCRDFIGRSPKAKLQWELERDFREFEREMAGR